LSCHCKIEQGLFTDETFHQVVGLKLDACVAFVTHEEMEAAKEQEAKGEQRLKEIAAQIRIRL
jgi:hypothetical protein